MMGKFYSSNSSIWLEYKLVNINGFKDAKCSDQKNVQLSKTNEVER